MIVIAKTKTYSWSLISLDYFYFPVFDIRVVPPPQQVPLEGSNVTYVCQVAEELGYTNPTWLNPQAQRIVSRVQGKNSL